jgi:hypothetical protein
MNQSGFKLSKDKSTLDDNPAAFGIHRVDLENRRS